MRVKIFQGCDTGAIEKDINNFLQAHPEVKMVLQSEAADSISPIYLTISIFYDELVTRERP